VSGGILVKNRQRLRPVNVRLLRWMTQALVQDHLCRNDFDLAIYIVNARTMTKLNEDYLHHEGSTDVITFDYTEPDRQKLAGELFICLDVAIVQAARFRTTWASELARYVVHGILHLCGHDDHDPAARRVMKRQEGRLLRLLDQEFGVAKLDGTSARVQTPRLPTSR
jgi:probable rRNA maturation factor